MAFDGIVTKSIISELQCLINSKIDKIYEPDSNTVILSLYLPGNHYALNVCIHPQNYRINITNHSKINPLNAPNFCMLLRKHLIGGRISKILMHGLERIVHIEIETLNEFKEIEIKTLIIELMGKHSNIILLDDKNIVMDSLRHTNLSSNSYRNIFPGQKYTIPSSEKHSFLNLNNFDEFYNIISKDLETESLDKVVCNNFTGISMSFIQNIISNNSISNNKSDLEKLYLSIKDVINNISSNKVSFNYTENKKDYVLAPTDMVSNLYDLNFFIDDFYYEKETKEQFTNFRNSILKLILDTLKKYNKRLLNLNNKIEECKNMDTYKLYGELITANLYKLNRQNLDYIELENYYDNNKLIKITLDKKYSPQENARRYFKKYNKLKTALSIVTEQKEETINDLNYLESIVFELENSTELSDLQEIFEEISESNIFKQKLAKKIKKSKRNNLSSKKQKLKFNPLKVNIDEYLVYIGRNNKENDYLTTKFANKNDIWFHTKDIHGSHVILKVQDNKIIPDEVIYQCAQIAAYHSKGRNSSNVPVDYCRIGFVKKPNGAKPGMVIYTNNKTLYIDPKKED